MKICQYCSNQINPAKQKTAKFCSALCRTKYGNRFSGWRKRIQVIGITRKLELIKLAGGSCKSCGYNKNLAGLSFHHIDPKTKLFNLGLDSIGNRTWESIINEMHKCELLCHNCHNEKHHPDYNITAINALLEEPSSQRG